MAKIKIMNEDRDEFKKTKNGVRKFIWMYVGMIVCFAATLAISILNIYADRLPNTITYYIILYLLLVIVVLGGELIGTYFGSLEQYVLEKKQKKELEVEE